MSKSAIITAGAGLGIGHGITRALAESGWNVLITGRKEAETCSFAEELSKEGAKVEAIILDVTEEDAPAKCVEKAIECFGGIDALVNNAGVGLAKTLLDATDAEFMQLFQVDFLAPLRLCRAALPELIKSRGSIINIGSVHVHAAAKKYAHYAATKCAMEGFTRGLAADYGKDGVRANIVHPGLVDSPQNDALIAELTDNVPAWLDNFASEKQCLPELVTARQVGELCRFLLSDHARTITGQKLFIDGGLTSLLWNNEN